MHRSLLLVALSAAVLLSSNVARAADSDGDGVDDVSDNCLNVPNNQLDADMDGYGNACDCDFNGDGICEGSERVSLSHCQNDPQWPDCAHTDMNGDGVIDSADGSLWSAMLQGSGVPGPSGLSCAGSSPCAPTPPTPSLPVIQVHEKYPPDGDLDQEDIDAALSACGAGCNLLFLADAYEGVTMEIDAFANGFAMYGYGPGVTVLRSPLFGEDDWDEVIFLGLDAPDGVRIESMTLDGRSGEQVPPTNGTALNVAEVQGHIGILTAPPFSGNLRSNGEIRNLEIRDFVFAGIDAWYAVDWVIEDNVVSGIGCHQVDVPCGDLLEQDPNPWDSLDDIFPNLPDRKMDGIGILLLSGSSGVVVANNSVSRVAKIGISVFEGNPDCESQWTPKNISITSNEVYECGSGIVANGGCDVTFTANRAHDMIATGAEGQNVGKGFSCGGDGENLTWVGNDSWANQGSGYGLSCNHSGIVLDDNTSSGNCVGLTGPNPPPVGPADVAVAGWTDPNGNWSAGVTITDLTSDSPACGRGLSLHRRSEVHVSGGSITGGTLGGIWIQGAHDVEIENLDVVSSNPSSGSDTGVFLSYNQPVVPVPLSEVYIQPTVNVTGFDNEVGFTAGHGLDDGDDVAYCKLEETPPAGCDVAP